jgi:hypothetical protein
VADPSEYPEGSVKAFADYADGGWSVEAWHYPKTGGWWLDAPDLEYDHGLIKPDHLALVLSDYCLNTLSDFVLSPDPDGWGAELRRMMLRPDLLEKLGDDHHGFSNLVAALFPKKEGVGSAAS